LTRRRRRKTSAVRSDGDRAAMLGPQRAATEDVRDDIASSAGGEQRPRREEERGEVHDRGLTRTARHRAREAVRREPATSRALRDDRRSWSFAVKRGSTWKAHSASGSAGSQPTAAGFRPRVSRHARHGASKGGPRLDRAPGIGQSVGAREVSRLQKSVRRIFLAASRGSLRRQRCMGPREGAR